MDGIANFHTHTCLCKHATGIPLDYARQAQQDGCIALGFSDHCPYPPEFPDTWPEVRMSCEQVPLYMQQVQDARQSVPFPVYAGFECEWDSAFKSWYKDELLGRYGAQYLVLGSHWVTQGKSHVYCPGLRDKALLMRYTDQTIDGMQSGLFAFLAHPDLFMKGYREWDDTSRSCLMAILAAARSLGIPLEVNGLGMSRTPNQTSRGQRYQYPYLEFWQEVAQSGVPVICNSDAHDPKDVIRNAQKARSFATDLGISPLLTIF